MKKFFINFSPGDSAVAKDLAFYQRQGEGSCTVKLSPNTSTSIAYLQSEEKL